jgi:hypothetical protein
MKSQGNVFVDDTHVGTFTMDSDDEIIIDMDGERFTAERLFAWTRQNHHNTVRFEPFDESTAA